MATKYVRHSMKHVFISFCSGFLSSVCFLSLFLSHLVVSMFILAKQGKLFNENEMSLHSAVVRQKRCNYHPIPCFIPNRRASSRNSRLSIQLEWPKDRKTHSLFVFEKERRRRRNETWNIEWQSIRPRSTRGRMTRDIHSTRHQLNSKVLLERP